MMDSKVDQAKRLAKELQYLAIDKMAEDHILEIVQEATAAGRQAGLREAAEVVASMCTRTFVQDDAYTKLFEASEAITALSGERN